MLGFFLSLVATETKLTETTMEERSPSQLKCVVTAPLPLSSSRLWEQVTSFCVLLIRLMEECMEGWMGGGGCGGGGGAPPTITNLI